MQPPTPPRLGIHSPFDAHLHGASDACTELQRLIDRLAAYQAQNDRAKPLLAEAMVDILTSPARNRLAFHLDALETRCTAVQEYERRRLLKAGT